MKSLISERPFFLKKNTFGSIPTDVTHLGSMYDHPASLFKNKLTVYPDFGLGSYTH